MTQSTILCQAVAAALLGVPLVGRSQAAPPFRVSSAPMLTIGAEDKEPAYQLDRVYGAVRLPDGRIAIGNFADQDAIFPRIFGTTLFAGDLSHARVNRYDFAGKVLPPLTLTSSPPAVQSILEATVGSRLIARVTASPSLQGAPGQRISTRYRYAFYDSMGMQHTPLFELPSRERIVHAWGGSIRFPYIPTVGRSCRMADTTAAH